MSRRARALLLAALAAVLFVPAIFAKDLWTPDEPRYAEVAREMRLSGDYLVPRRNQEVYREKPPLLFWLMAASAAPFGEMNEVAARIPSVLAAILTVLLTFDLASRMYSPRIGVWSAIVLMTGLRFWVQAHIGQIDMLLAACMTLSLYALWRRHETQQPRWLGLFYVGIALGLYAKGPPALVFPLLGAIAFYWGDREQRKQLRLAIGIPACLIAIALWLIPARIAAHAEASSDAAGDIGANLFKQVIGRIFLGVSHAQPPWYYLENFIVDWFPWTLFMPWTVWFIWRNRRQGSPMRLLLAWTVPALVFFTLTLGKRAVYLLPLYPAFAILTAQSLVALIEQDRRKWMAGVASVWLVCLAAIAVLPGLVRFTQYADAWQPRMLVLTAVAIGGIAATVAVIVGGYRRRLPAAMAVQMAALLVASTITVIPAVNHFKTAKSFCDPVRTLAENGGVKVQSAGFTREEYIFYSRAFQRVTLELPGRDALVEGGLASAGAKAYELRSKMAEACAGRPITNYARPTTSERAAMEAGVNRAIDASDLPEESRRAYRAAVRAEVGKLWRQAACREPVVIFVQERDWRWILAFAPQTHDLTVLKNEDVGSRRVLLLANRPAAQRLRQLDYVFDTAQDGVNHIDVGVSRDPGMRGEGGL